jgi:hypothetical protein
MRKLTILAALGMATAAFALPSTAPAAWTDNHNDLQFGKVPQVHGEGSAAFQSSAGQINCTSVTASGQMWGSQTTGFLDQFSATAPQSWCHTNGGVIGHCTATFVQAETPRLAHVNTTNGVQVTGVEVFVDLHGFLCPDIALEVLDAGNEFVELTADSGGGLFHETVDALVIEGVGTATPLENQVNIQGTISATPGQQDRYGWT